MSTEDKSEDFFSYKKVLLFGDESTGKSSFANKLKGKKFDEDIQHSEEGKLIFNYLLIIDVIPNKIEYELKDGKFLSINLIEIRPVENIINNINLFDAFFFDCQCALFLIDMTNPNCILSIKNILNCIKINNYPNLKIFIVENKSDVQSETENKELKKFNNFYSQYDIMEISIKTGDNFDELINSIYEAVNYNIKQKNSIPINQVSRTTPKTFEKEKFKKSISLILVGDKNVGKTNFLLRYSKNVFNQTHLDTIGMEKDLKALKINDNNYYKLILWDTAGQERFRSLPKKYYRNIDGVLLLFDVNNRDTFEDVSNWMKDINEFGFKAQEEGNEDKSTDIMIYLIGNKIDRVNNDEERKVTKEEAKKLAGELGVKYYEISCKWDLNLEEVMARIILDCSESSRTIIHNIIRLKQDETKSKKGCCLSSKKETKKDK